MEQWIQIALSHVKHCLSQNQKTLSTALIWAITSIALLLKRLVVWLVEAM